MHYLQSHPEIVKYEEEFNKEIELSISKLNLSNLRTTADTMTDTTWLDIPIVVHIIHDYNYNAGSFQDYLTDDYVFQTVEKWNQVFSCRNTSDTAQVIAPFKKYVGNARIRLHLATIDPQGNRTKGITRRRSHLTYRGSDQAKYDIWAPSSYVNIWVINKMSAANGNAAAYATPPTTAAAFPYSDGVLTLSEYFDQDNTINHEIGHVFSLIHPWGQTNSAQCGTCADNGTDQVDDTPPTIGHYPDGCRTSAFTSRPSEPGCSPTVFTQGNIYDTICARNYFKIYTRTLTGTFDSLENYPDTTNAQNIMDYTYCSKMFTKGQVARMRAALNSTVAGRKNLWQSANLASTGALLPRPDLKPIPDYAVIYGSGSVSAAPTVKIQHFTCPGVPLRFLNRSHNDTITKLKFTFTNASGTVDTFNNPNYNTTVTKTFNQSGWATVTLTATGNRTGDSTITRSDVYVTDSVATPAVGYFQEFNPSGDMQKWPFFNYYNNNFKWESATSGFYDGHCIKYNGFDTRVGATGIPITGSPFGDFDDLFSIPFDLTALAAGQCNLNFYTSAASRFSNSANITDTLQIDYSIDKGKTWVRLSILSKGGLINKGSYETAYTPSNVNDWKAQTISIPAAARTNYTLFRFRYRPGVDGSFLTYSTGNNFYMDRIHFSPYPAEVSGIPVQENSVVIAPNPTEGNAYVIFKNVPNSSAKIIVTDISGKTVYATEQSINGSEARVEIPADAIAVKGIYLVQTLAGGQKYTQKLVVY